MTETQLWGGRLLSGMKVAKAHLAVDGTKQLGYPEESVAPMGVVLLLCTLLYAVLRTSFIGAILLTG